MWTDDLRDKVQVSGWSVVKAKDRRVSNTSMVVVGFLRMSFGTYRKGCKEWRRLEEISVERRDFGKSSLDDATVKVESPMEGM